MQYCLKRQSLKLWIFTTLTNKCLTLIFQSIFERQSFKCLFLFAIQNWAEVVVVGVSSTDSLIKLIKVWQCDVNYWYLLLMIKNDYELTIWFVNVSYLECFSNLNIIAYLIQCLERKIKSAHADFNVVLTNSPQSYQHWFKTFRLSHPIAAESWVQHVSWLCCQSLCTETNPSELKKHHYQSGDCYKIHPRIISKVKLWNSRRIIKAWDAIGLFFTFNIIRRDVVKAK